MEGHRQAELSYSFPDAWALVLLTFPINPAGNPHTQSSRFHRLDQCYSINLCTQAHKLIHKYINFVSALLAHAMQR